MECKFDRCPSAAGSSNSSSSDSSLDGNGHGQSMQSTGLQHSNKDLQPPSRPLVGKRFFVSRIHPQQILALDNSEEKANSQNDEEKPEQIDGQELISFRYTWPVRISERLIGADESAILNVSPPFCTAHNGVQFTWLLRICEENILDFGCPNDGGGGGTISSRTQLPDDGGGFGDGFEGDDEVEPFGRKKVNITLYYKEGPARDVKLHAGNISIRNAKGVLFNNLPLRDLEYTKGGGWSPISCPSSMAQMDGCCGGITLTNDDGGGQHRKFSQFIHDHVGKQITVRVKLEMPASLFQPMQYLPSIDSPFNGKLEEICAKVLDQIRSSQLPVPDVEFFDPKTDKYALYRHVYQFACQEIFQRFSREQIAARNCGDEEPELMDKIRNIFAHYYFNTVIVREAECFEDFLDALDACRHVQFPALRRECERYICAEVMAESADLMLVKKMLLLAERFNLPVLKMVSFGVIVDRLLMQQKEENNASAGGTNSNSSSQPAAAVGELTIGSSSQPSSLSLCSTPPRKSVDSGGSGGQQTTIESSMEEIREELLEIAEQIIHPDHQQHNLSSTCPNQQQQHLLQIGIDGTSQSAGGIPIKRVHSKSLCSPRGGEGGGGGISSASSNSEDEENIPDEEEEEAESDPGGETLVGSVIAQLEELARHIRKVSMPSGVRPAPLQNGRPSSPEFAQNANSSTPKSIFHQNSGGGMDSGNGSILMDSRRSSLKTGRDILLQQHRQERSDDSTESGHSLDEAANFEGPSSFFAQLYCPPPSSQIKVETRPASSCDCVPQKFGKNCATKKIHRPKFAATPIEFGSGVEYWPNAKAVNDENEGDEGRPIRKNAVVAFQTKIIVGIGQNNEDEGVGEGGDLVDSN